MGSTSFHLGINIFVMIYYFNLFLPDSLLFFHFLSCTTYGSVIPKREFQNGENELTSPSDGGCAQERALAQ